MRTGHNLAFLIAACWLNLTLGAPPSPAPNEPVCNRIRFFPAKGAEQAMVGGRFEGSNVSWREGFEPLAEIKTAPPAGEWCELKLDNAKVYRWLRYVGPRGSHVKVAELEFYAGPRKLSSPGLAYSCATDTGGLRRFAFDGDTKTVFESRETDGAYIGIDLRELATARCPQFTPQQAVQAAPGVWPLPAVQDAPFDVTLKCPTPGSVIRYTLDGTWPTEKNGSVYTTPIPIKKTTTIQAVSFLKGRAPSPPIAGTYWVKGSTKPGQNTFHWGNSLTATTGLLSPYIRTAGYTHGSAIFARPGAWTKELWDIGLVQEKDRAMGLWNSFDRLDHVTLQPRDFNIEEEAGYDIKFFNMAREKSSDVQPWLYCEWTEVSRQRPTDKGEVPSRQMKKLFPALTWEESMGAMLLYVEELQSKVCETYREEKRPRVLPTALAMGRIRNMIDHGKLPGIAPGSFYPLLFADQVHPSVTPFNGENGNGGYLVDLTWYAAFYRESPEGKILPVGTTFTPEQNAIIQRLAWDVIKNYPDCGLYEDGTKPCGKPEIVNDGKTIALKSATPGAWFRYTLDGTTPTRTRGYVYCGVIGVQPGIQVKAIAFKSGMADSEVTEAAPVAAMAPNVRMFTCGHSFHVFVYRLTAQIAKSAGFDHQMAGSSSIGGSRVIQHWDVAEAKNEAKAALRTGKVDVMTLSPIWLPDEGIENFARLGLEHNPNVRITVQEYWLPNDEYVPVYPLQTRKTPKVDHNATNLATLRKEQARYDRDVDDYLRAINKKLGKNVLFAVPVGQAAVALREKIVAGQAPGLKAQWDLFRDPWGHPQPPLQVLDGYCHYAVIYRRSPVGLPVPPDLARLPDLTENEKEKLNRLLQELAWDAVRQHPLSGLADANPARK